MRFDRTRSWPRGGWPRRRLLELSVTVAVVGILAWLLGWNVGRAPVDVIATIPPAPSLSWPAEYAAGKGPELRHEDYLGLLVATSEPRRGDPREEHCLIVVHDISVLGSCAPDGFEAFVDIRVEPGSPEALVEQFPTDTMLRISHDGESVTVRRHFR